MKKNIIHKGIRFYNKYGIKGGIAVLTGQGQINERKYAKWYEEHRITDKELKWQKQQSFLYSPIISIVVPVYNTPIDFLVEMIESVRNQSYCKWQLCIANASPYNVEIKRKIKYYLKHDERIKAIDVPENLGIAQNTNKALDIATGEYVGFLDHDDILAPNALYEVVKILNEKEKPDIIYTNEDKITRDGRKHFQPNFKPEFNLDLLRSNNYICHFFIVDKKIVEEVGGLQSEYNGAQDYDLIFRCVEKTSRIVRISKILYHWRMHSESTAENPESKLYAFEAGKRAIFDHLRRCGENGDVEITDCLGFYRIQYALERKPLISIVIVEKNKKGISYEMIKKMITEYDSKKVEIVIVTSKKQSYYFQYPIDIKIVIWNEKYDYYSMLNKGIECSKAEYVLILNDKIKEISKNYIREFASNIIRDEVGIVGGKLYYSNNTIKNAGLLIKDDRSIKEVFKGLPQECVGYMNRQSIQQNMEAVILDDMMIKKDIWKKVGGFEKYNTELQVAVKFCHEVAEQYSLIVYNPCAKAICRR